MKLYIARNVLIVRLAALALCALCFLQTPVRAQGMVVYNVIFPSVGLPPNHSLRLTIFNPNDTPVHAQARSRHSGGILVGMADGSVRAGSSHSFNFNHSDIAMPCYENTCRKQILASVSLTFSEAVKPILASMEVISITDGTSNTILFGEVIPSSPSSGSGRDVLIGGSGSDHMMGFVPGQEGRVTIYNPSRLILAEDGSYERSKPVNGHVKVFDGSGDLIAQSPEMVIPPDEFLTYVIKRESLPILGEPGTNRAQVRIKPFFTFQSARLSTSRQGDDQILVSYEIVDSGTGKTMTLAGQQCLVFFLGGEAK